MGIIFKMYANESKGEKFPQMHTYQSANCDNFIEGTPDYTIDTSFQANQLYPEYLTDINVLLCPSDANTDNLSNWYQNSDPSTGIVQPCKIDAMSYNYWGWALSDTLVFADPSVGPTLEIVGVLDLDLSDEDKLAFFEFIMKQPKVEATDAPRFDQDFGCVYRLREGIERFFITDINNPSAGSLAQSELWIMWDDVSAARAEAMNHIPGGCNVLYMDGHVRFLRYGGESPISKGMVQVLSGNVQ